MKMSWSLFLVVVEVVGRAVLLVEPKLLVLLANPHRRLRLRPLPRPRPQRLKFRLKSPRNQSIPTHSVGRSVPTRLRLLIPVFSKELLEMFPRGVPVDPLTVAVGVPVGVLREAMDEAGVSCGFLEELGGSVDPLFLFLSFPLG